MSSIEKHNYNVKRRNENWSNFGTLQTMKNTFSSQGSLSINMLDIHLMILNDTEMDKQEGS